ncbi:lysine--tRNA ligase [Candidatus Gottesmanbacteria bacterium RBG_16_52_11]|uniref:Lysine--tRNA ligase n=1 Tax=Candidatus Gottesmanbacteria bacterium RBG_16_52_11 TaxID=1798374 RepID=A0A1F5YMK1_9BACT|nr:MAG: lysine--tRNA ligase [Candidatus Gottesmanbacteria bacterium RBG_16_52_11]
MFWADRIAREIIESGRHRPFWVDDMYTPSGYAHTGSLRGPLVHDMVFRAIRDAGEDVSQTYVFNDFDPIDGLPDELREGFTRYMGFPLRSVPSPDGIARSFGDYFAEDFRRVLTEYGFGGKFLSSWDMYHEGKFNDAVRTALDAADRIQDIYQRVSGSRKRERGWLPLQVICESCGRLGTTRVHDWDGRTVGYTCEPDLVTWAKGCGHKGRINPFDGNGKLPWKVDWSAHWKVMGVTIEGAGKDHSSAGGSRDIARALCDEVFHYPDPFNLPYEFFLIGGKKMSSSKGLGLKARDLTGVLPPVVGRFLNVRTDYRQAIEFEPVGTMAIPDLFDEYDRAYRAHVTGSDANLARAFELSQIDGSPPKKEVFLPRFRDVANYRQQGSVDLTEKFAGIKGAPLNQAEKLILTERLHYAAVWTERYAPDQYRYRLTDKIPDTVGRLDAGQSGYLESITGFIKSDMPADQLQQALYKTAKDSGVNPKQAFAAVYLALIGRDSGPKAAWLIRQYPADRVISRLKEAAAGISGNRPENQSVSFITKPEIFSVDEEVRRRFPSVSVGVAVIRGITVKKSDPGLEAEKQALITELSGLTTERIGKFPEVLSYRRLYREMGIDWHSKRPTTEALLRRIAQGKGIPAVNTCVDAYNLTVIRHRVSNGAFDADHIRFPTRLRFAGAGDEILLIGDDQPAAYSGRELAYYDQEGGYNINFNFRDARRTMVTEKTRNILINVDGVYDITPEKVNRTLRDCVDLVTGYCGGTVEFAGVVR